MTFNPKPLPNNWQTSDPEVLCRSLNRLSDALTDTNRQIASSFVQRTESLDTGGVPTLATAQFSAQFDKALRVGCPTSMTARVVMPAASAADAFRDVDIIRTSTGGTLTALPSAGYLINGATLLSIPNRVGRYSLTFDGMSFYGRNSL